MPERSITTEVWTDERFDALAASAKLVYLRLVTGPETSSAGATRVPVAVLAASAGLTPKAAGKAVDDLVEADLVRRYDGGWLWLPTFIRYQLSGPMFIRSIRRSMTRLPDALRKSIDRTLVDVVGPDRARTDPGQTSDKKTRSKQAKLSRTPHQSANGPPVSRQSEGEKDQDQDQDQDQNPRTPSGSSGFVGTASPSPAPGAPSTPSRRGGDLLSAEEAARRGLVGPRLAGVLARRGIVSGEAP